MVGHQVVESKRPVLHWMDYLQLRRLSLNPEFGTAGARKVWSSLDPLDVLNECLKWGSHGEQGRRSACGQYVLPKVVRDNGHVQLSCADEQHCAGS